MEDEAHVNVFFLDNRYMTFPIASGEIVGELRNRVSRRLRLPPKIAECFEIFGARKGAVPGQQLARDATVSTKNIRLLYAARLVTDAMVGVRCRKYCVRLAFAQAAFDVVSGRYACGTDTAILLASLQYCATSEEKQLSRLIDEFVPRPMVASKSPEEWEFAILNEVEKIRSKDDKSRPVAVSEEDWYCCSYLDIVESWPCYGTTLIPCSEISVFRVAGEKVLSHSIARMRGDIALGISRTSITFACAVSRRKERTLQAPPSRFFGPDACSSAIELEKLKRWGHRTGAEFYVEVPAAASAKVLEAFFGDAKAITKLYKKDNPPHGDLRLSCATTEGARANALLRDYALAKLRCDDERAMDEDDKSTTDEEDCRCANVRSFKVSVRTARWRR